MENNQHNINDELLTRYLTGETSSEENVLVENWINAAEQNKRRMAAFSKILDAGEQLGKNRNNLADFDIDKAWEKVKSQTIERQSPKIIPIWRIAAVWIGILMMAGIALFYIKRNTAAEVSQFVAKNNGDSLKLPDNSHVLFARGGSIEYQKSFDKKERLVKLKGEAFFKVARNPEQPFHIIAGETDIVVLGTSFNVKQTDSFTEIFVQSGKVKVTAAKQFVILTAGQKAIAKKGGAPQIISADTENELSYLTGKLKFNNTRLSDAIETLSKHYKIKIGLENPELGDCTINTTFNREEPENVLNIISATIGLTWTKDSKGYTLKGEGCK